MDGKALAKMARVAGLLGPGLSPTAVDLVFAKARVPLRVRVCKSVICACARARAPFCRATAAARAETGRNPALARREDRDKREQGRAVALPPPPHPSPAPPTPTQNASFFSRAVPRPLLSPLACAM